ncbi:putative membrane protein [Mucinivorans hirudinis]|uniref:Putative membrane protein n=1 Tax=Mucinivorans hirudinis TaxID=1433126 RepID=A0A060R5Q7_9BACT|nr:putative membrane protein [Mucinivorans hirudinis]
MKTTYKFILRAYVGPMVLTFIIVMFILLVQFLWMKIDHILGKGLSIGVIIELLMYVCATSIPMALPLATLLASIMTLGNLGEYNELLALKAAGVSLPRIIKPLIVLMIAVCIGSFFVANNLTPYSWQQMMTLLTDFGKTKHELKLQDGIFFNGLDNMSIRVDHQDPNSHKLTNVLIYDNQDREMMRTIVADSGYLKMSKDRKFIILTLYNGQIYEQNRNWEWYDKNVLSHHIFDFQESMIPTEGFSLSRSDMELFKNSSETKNMNELSYAIDSLKFMQDSLLNNFTKNMVKNNLLSRFSRYEKLDSLPQLELLDVSGYVDTMNVNDRSQVFTSAKTLANNSKSYLSYELEMVKYYSSQLYRAQENYQKKLALPFSIMIFFLIGAPLGAIIRKGGLGMPIVISVSFFVFYYIISITGDNLVRDGALPAYIGIWMSSLVLFPIAIFLTYKSANDSALLNAEVYIMKIKKIKAFFRKIYDKNSKHNS